MSSYGAGDCCEAKVDIITLITALGAIAGLSLWLRQQVIDFMIMMATGRKKRSSISHLVLLGKHAPFRGEYFNKKVPK